MRALRYITLKLGEGQSLPLQYLVGLSFFNTFMKTGINPRTVALLYLGTFAIFTLILVLISYFNGKNLLEYMITIYMGIIICGTASVLLIKEVERRAQKEKLNRKQLSTLRLLTLCCLFVFTPASIVIIRLLISRKILSDILTLSIIPLVFIACYSIRSKMILKYTIKDFS